MLFEFKKIMIHEALYLGVAAFVENFCFYVPKSFLYFL